jgi:hypothetical protein
MPDGMLALSQYNTTVCCKVRVSKDRSQSRGEWIHGAFAGLLVFVFK